MTVIAGFKAYDGVILCAYTQETIGHSKRGVSKLRFEPSDRYTPSVTDHSALVTAFCGAGHGPFIDKLVEEGWRAAQGAASLSHACDLIEERIACDLIEERIKEQYYEFGKIYQPNYCPEVQLIYGVRMGGESRLFSASGPIVNQKKTYESSGIGQYIADFLASRMYADHMDVHACVILAAYILHQAKEHVEGCGGDSQIAVLRDAGVSGRVDWKRVETITELLQHADREIGQLLVQTGNLSLKQSDFDESLGLMKSTLDSARQFAVEEIDRFDSMSLFGEKEPVDEFGLPLAPLDDGPPRDSN